MRAVMAFSLICTGCLQLNRLCLHAELETSQQEQAVDQMLWLVAGKGGMALTQMRLHFCTCSCCGCLLCRAQARMQNSCPELLPHQLCTVVADMVLHLCFGVLGVAGVPLASPLVSPKL